ncbi:hypothetical protein [Sporosarcina limicola]|uniref:Uncharacterized protein n=1 Tax=Sporosarcina limicola TaxID=34101 RepID=A0A927MKD2_9BACL|nr:hypothetical protein [Sporosarcina limicola]MBE1554562.1 hypothetical protein [Sporosarcina limicola]
MEKKQWEMQEDFIFPEQAGLPAGTESITVTPRFTEERTEDAVRLTGIYHIAADIEFEEGKRVEGYQDTAVLIDDVELNEKVGYFEYAVPLHIDLPPEVESPLQVVTTTVIGEPDGQGAFSVVWNVECSYKQSVALDDPIVLDKPIVQDALVVQNEPVVQDVPGIQNELVVQDDLGVQNELVVQDDPIVLNEPVVLVTNEVAQAVIETPIATYDSTSFNETDEVLSFIAGLEDGVTTKSFQLNDVLVQNKS